MVSGKLNRVLFLYTNTAGYMERCWEYAAHKGDCQILVICYNTLLPESQNGIIYKKAPPDFKSLYALVFKFIPEIVFISGWSNFNYLKIGRILKAKNILTIGLADTPFKGNLKQWFGKLLAPYFLHKSFEYFWVCDERQKKLISFYGYPASRIRTGLYTCDHSIFFPNNEPSNKRFIFIGKKNAIKGWDILINAYNRYIKTVNDAWDLEVVDGGNPKSKLSYYTIPYLLRNADCLILPSRKEPWGMVIHEAVASGCLVIATKSCGSSDVFLKNNENGILINKPNTKLLSNAMLQIHKLTNRQLELMKLKSYELSFNYNLNRWDYEFRCFLAKIRKL
jgi:glycosyltransferase involved in cell wall biosynthesis